MAISFVGGATGSSAGNTDVSVDLTALTGGSDSAPSNGDFIVFAYNIADADNVDLDLACNTAGFAEIADLFGNGTQDANLGVYWKIHDGDTAVVGEGSLGGTDTAIQAAVMVFRGVDQTTPLDATTTTATGTTGGLPDPASIDLVTAGAWTVIVGANAHAAGAGGVFTGPTNYTTNFLSRGDVNDTADGIIGMGYNPSPSDPENPGAFADNIAGTGWCAATLALRPAPSGTEYTSEPAGSLGFSGADAKRTGKALDAGASFAGSAVRAVSHVLSGDVSFSAAAAKAAARQLSGALSFSGLLVASRLFAAALDSALSFVGSLASQKAANALLEASLSFVGAQTTRTSRALAGAVGFAAGVSKRTGRALSGVLGHAAALSRRAARGLAGALSLSGLLAASKAVNAFLTASMSFAGSLATATMVNVLLEAALSFSGAARRAASRGLTGTLSVAGQLTKRTHRALGATLDVAGQLTKRVGKALSGALSFLGDLASLLNPVQVIQVGLTATMSFAGELRRTFPRALASALSFAAAMGLRLPARFADFIARAFSWRLARRGADWVQGRRETTWVAEERSAVWKPHRRKPPQW